MVHLAPGGAMPMQIVKTVYRALADCAFVTPPSERQWETLYGKEVKRRWRDIYTAANTTDMPARHQEIAYRLAVQRLYTGERLLSAGRCAQGEECCFWCRDDRGLTVAESHVHAFLECPAAYELWDWILTVFSRHAGVDFVLTPATVLLGVLDRDRWKDVGAEHRMPKKEENDLAREEVLSVWHCIRGYAIWTLWKARNALRFPDGDRAAGVPYSGQSLRAACKAEIAKHISRNHAFPFEKEIAVKKNFRIFGRWLRRGVFATFRNGELVCFP